MSVKLTCFAGSLTALSLIAVPGALAQANPLDAVIACRQIQDANARLQCFDTAVGQLEGASEAGDLVTVTRSEIEAVERDSFGLSLPSIPFLSRRSSGRDAAAATAGAGMTAEQRVPRPEVAADGVEVLERDDEGRIIRMRMRVASARQVRGEWVFTMENGQVWRQTENRNIPVPRSRADFDLEIRARSLGSFTGQVNGSGRAVRIRRDQ
ncbi:hypothetical protein [Maricaulis sp.]|uniref:hypothetical protein n=1 Tax=Maricaulis sp. TaxID=1486257 RepID=UPI00262A769A|nr:hypothetical protein [Maricaulis sp.]